MDADLAHVVVGVIKQAKFGTLVQFFNFAALLDIPSILALSSKDIDELVFHEKVGNKVHNKPLQPAYKNLIRAFKSFIKVKKHHGTTVWTELTATDFNEFRVTEYNPDDVFNDKVQPPQPNTTPTSTTVTKPPIVSKLVEFRKTIKRDKAQYIVLKDDKQWDKWR